jgi:hypothetical protein
MSAPTPAAAAGFEASKGSKAKTDDVAGLVLRVSGDWQRQLGDQIEKIKQGDGVPNGSRLKCLSKDGSGSMTVVLTDGSKITCPECAACNSPISVSKQDNAAGSWFAAAINQFVKKPNAWAVAESRSISFGSAEISIREAVLKEEGAGVDIAPVFSTPLDGSYFVSVGKVDATPGLVFGPQQIKINKDKPVIIKAPRLKPGLFRINISRTKEDQGSEAWMLVTDQQHYQKDASQFKEAESACEDLKPDAAPNAVQELLRAYMSSMDAGNSSK